VYETIREAIKQTTPSPVLAEAAKFPSVARRLLALRARPQGNPCQGSPAGGLQREGRRFRFAGAMFTYGELHHYRVVSGDGEVYLIPPDWIVSLLPTLVPADEDSMLRAGS
jgi:hypothetical protein